MVYKYVYNKIAELKHEQKTVRFCLDVCSIIREGLPYLPHLGKLTFGLLHAALATKQR